MDINTARKIAANMPSSQEIGDFLVDYFELDSDEMRLLYAVNLDAFCREAANRIDPGRQRAKRASRPTAPDHPVCLVVDND